MSGRYRIEVLNSILDIILPFPPYLHAIVDKETNRRVGTVWTYDSKDAGTEIAEGRARSEASGSKVRGVRTSEFSAPVIGTVRARLPVARGDSGGVPALVVAVSVLCLTAGLGVGLIVLPFALVWHNGRSWASGARGGALSFAITLAIALAAVTWLPIPQLTLGEYISALQQNVFTAPIHWARTFGSHSDLSDCNHGPLLLLHLVLMPLVAFAGLILGLVLGLYGIISFAAAKWLGAADQVFLWFRFSVGVVVGAVLATATTWVLRRFP